MDSNIRTLFGEKIDMFWLDRESAGKTYRCVLGDCGKAYGAYQDDYRYGLVPFMTYCVEKNPEHYSEFNKFINYGAGNEALMNNKELANLMISYCDKYGEEYYNLQDEYNYYYYYTPAKEYCVKKNLPVDNFSPVLKGSLYSFAIRSGTESGAKKLVHGWLSGKTDERGLLKYAYGTYGDADDNRWNVNKSNSQYADAIRIYNDLVSKGEVKEPEVYRVGTTWENGKCVGQIGAFTDFENAKKACKEGYTVYNTAGKVMYTVKKKETDNRPVYAVGVYKDNKLTNTIGDFRSLNDAKAEADKRTTYDLVYSVLNEAGKVVYTSPAKKKPEAPAKTDNTIKYKVGTNWRSKKCIGQIGAYSNLDNAKRAADAAALANKQNYYVFTLKGFRQYLAQPFEPYDVKTSSAKVIYSKPDGTAVGTAPIGVYGIVGESKSSSGLLWGKLKSGAGWIQLVETTRK